MMILKDKIEKLAKETSSPCITISLNTHRTRPNSEQDKILLKNLVKEAEKRILDDYGKKTETSLLDKLAKLADKIDMSDNLDSLHIFLSNDTEEIIKIAWNISENRVFIGESFDLRSIIKAYNRNEEYLILLLSQGGVLLYEAMNDGIINEITNDDFPFDENPYYTENSKQKSNAKLVEDKIKEFFNIVDKAVIRVTQETALKCIVISTEDNYSKLLQVADKPDIYLSHIPIDYNKTKPHQIAQQSWLIIKQLIDKKRADAISEMKDAISHEKLLTNLESIYQAAIDGRGDMLIVHEDYTQPALINDRNIELAKDITDSDVVDDIVSFIAWEVLSKNGRVFFTRQEQLKDLGNIALKLRY